MIKVNLISLFCHRTLARLRMADGTPPHTLSTNTTAIIALGNSLGRPPGPICDSQNGRRNSQDQLAIFFFFR